MSNSANVTKLLIWYMKPPAINTATLSQFNLTTQYHTRSRVGWACKETLIWLTYNVMTLTSITWSGLYWEMSCHWIKQKNSLTRGITNRNGASGLAIFQYSVNCTNTYVWKRIENMHFRSDCGENQQDYKNRSLPATPWLRLKVNCPSSALVCG